MRQHQVLHGELCVHHAARAVLHVKMACLQRVGCPHPFAHHAYFRSERRFVARCRDNGQANGLKPLAHGICAQHQAGPCHRLVFPGPGGVAAPLFLVDCEGVKMGNQQA